MKEELKPCPFCGIKRKIEVDEDDMFCVQCMKCGARTDWYLYDSDAIKAWNARQPDKELVEALKEIETYTKDSMDLRALHINKACEQALARQEGD